MWPLRVFCGKGGGKVRESTLLVYSHSATWWKSWGFIYLHSECFSARTFAAPFCVRPCVRHAGSGCDLLPVAMELTFQDARGHLDHLLYRSVVKALVEAASISNMVLKGHSSSPRQTCMFGSGLATYQLCYLEQSHSTSLWSLQFPLL